MKKKKSFFTLVEMMLVLAIIAILFGLGTVMFTKASEKSEIALAKTQIASLTAAIEMYQLRWGQFPKSGGNSKFDFAHWLSKVSPVPGVSGNWPKDEKRPMYAIAECAISRASLFAVTILPLRPL